MTESPVCDISEAQGTTSRLAATHSSPSCRRSERTNICFQRRVCSALSSCFQYIATFRLQYTHTHKTVITLMLLTHVSDECKLRRFMSSGMNYSRKCYLHQMPEAKTFGAFLWNRMCVTEDPLKCVRARVCVDQSFV